MTHYQKWTVIVNNAELRLFIDEKEAVNFITGILYFINIGDIFYISLLIRKLLIGVHGLRTLLLIGQMNIHSFFFYFVFCISFLFVCLIVSFFCFVCLFVYLLIFFWVIFLSFIVLN